MLIALKIDVTKLDKARFFQGKNGAVYADLLLNLKDDLSEDQYGNCGFMSQSVTKEERLAGTKLPILGNAKLLAGPKQEPASGQGHRLSPPASNNPATPQNFADDTDIPF
jgi:hypothetical protein